jgi:hypothetical protein
VYVSPSARLSCRPVSNGRSRTARANIISVKLREASAKRVEKKGPRPSWRAKSAQKALGVTRSAFWDSMGRW